MDYKKHIGDGKLPNRYWVFQYDEKFTRNVDGEKYEPLESIGTIPENKKNLLGEFKTYQEAVNCINIKAYLPHVTMEDRITGMIYESFYMMCPCCRKGEFVERNDISFTKKFIEEHGFTFK